MTISEKYKLPTRHVVAIAADIGLAKTENESIVVAAHEFDLYNSRAIRMTTVPMSVATLRMAKNSSNEVLFITNTKCRGEE